MRRQSGRKTVYNRVKRQDAMSVPMQHCVLSLNTVAVGNFVASANLFDSGFTATGSNAAVQLGRSVCASHLIQAE